MLQLVIHIKKSIKKVKNEFLNLNLEAAEKENILVLITMYQSLEGLLSSGTISFPLIEIDEPFTSAEPPAIFAANNGNEGLQKNNCYTITPLQFYWLEQAIKENLLLHAVFISQFVVDDLPMQRLCRNNPFFWIFWIFDFTKCAADGLPKAQLIFYW